jgi:hypothetical protein
MNDTYLQECGLDTREQNSLNFVRFMEGAVAEGERIAKWFQIIYV